MISDISDEKLRELYSLQLKEVDRLENILREQNEACLETCREMLKRWSGVEKASEK